jgi:hypothetical protein
MTTIFEHLEDLRARYRLQPLTLRLYCTLFKVWYGWHCEWSPEGKINPIGAQDKAKLDNTLKSIGRYYFKLSKTVKRKAHKSIEEMIACRKWPANGFQDLLAAIAPHIKRILAMDPPSSIVTSDAGYNDFMQVMVCGLYGHGVQGRVGGVKSILLSQAQDLVEDGML